MGLCPRGDTALRCYTRPQAFQYDPDLPFNRMVFAHGAADVFDKQFSRFTEFKFGSHVCSPYPYDKQVSAHFEPEDRLLYLASVDLRRYDLGR